MDQSWAETYRNHSVWQTIKDKKKALLANSYSEQGIQYRDQLIEVLDLIDITVPSQPLLYLSALDTLASALANIAIDEI